MEAALSANHILKLSSRSDMLFHFVPFSCFFSYMHYSQRYGASNTKGWDLEKWVRASLTRQLRKPWFPNSRFQHSWLAASTNPKAPSWKTRTHMADGECCWMSMFFVASEPWRTAVENLHSCRRNSFRMTQSRFLVIWAMEIHSTTEHGHYQGRQVQDWNMMAAKCFEII